MRRREAVVILHCLEHALVEPHAAGDVLSDDSLEADSGELAFVRDGFCVLELREAVLDRLGIIGHALEAALVQERLGTCSRSRTGAT